MRPSGRLSTFNHGAVDLKAELDDRTAQLHAVQRNYDSLSRLMQVKQQEVEQYKQQYDAEAARAVSLSVKLEDALQRAQKAEAAVAKLGHLPDQLAALQNEYNKMKYDASVANGKVQSNTDMITSLQRMAEDAEFNANKMRREVDTWKDGEKAARDSCQKIQKELEGAQAEGRSLMSEVRATRDAMAKAQQAAAAAEQRCLQLGAKLSSKDEQVAGLQDTIRSLQDEVQECRSALRAGEVALQTSRTQQTVAEAQVRSMSRSLELSREAHGQLGQQAEELREQLGRSKESCASLDAEVHKLRGLLSDAEERYQQSLTQKLEASDGLTRLQVQLAQTKAVLTDTRQQLEDSEARAEAARVEAAAQIKAAQQQASDAVARSLQARHRFHEYLATLMHRVDGQMETLAALQSRMGRGLAELSDKQEKLLGVLGQKLALWEQYSTDLEERVSAIHASLQRYASSTARRNARALQTQQSDAASAARLRDTVANLEGMLRAEQAAKQTLAQAKARMEASHAEAIAAVRATADERVESERQRLGARLAAVESEVARLQEACEGERQAAKQMVAMERDEMARQIEAARAVGDGLRAQIAQLEERLGLAGKHELALLSSRHLDEVEGLNKQHGLAVAALQSKLDLCRSCISSTWEASQKLLADMGVVASHLVKLGWEVKQSDPAAVASLGQEDGSGSVLPKAALLLRLHFSYITEAVQNMARKPPPAAAAAPPPPPPQAKPTDWSALARELRTTVAKLIHVEEALATSCTCLLCLEVLQQPTTCVPCGHTYCKACLDKHGMRCAECGDAPVETTLLNGPLDTICSKHEYKLSALHSIQKAMAQAGPG